MNASEIVSQFRAKGVTVSVEGERLKVSPPLLSETDRTFLLTNKTELISFLRTQGDLLRREFLSLWKAPHLRPIDTVLLSRILGRPVRQNVRTEFALLTLEELERLVLYAKTGRTDAR